MSASVTHILDTSALLAYYLKENGWDLVHQLIFDETCQLRVSSGTWLEFHVRLSNLTSDTAQRAEAMELYRALLGEGIPVDDAIAAHAYHLRQTAASRLPNMDALIAATAAVNGAILVHRDPHMAGIPISTLPQMVLPNK